jgi:hypothetical protein
MTTITRYRGRTSIAISLITALLLALPLRSVRADSNPNPGVLPPDSPPTETPMEGGLPHGGNSCRRSLRIITHSSIRPGPTAAMANRVRCGSWLAYSTRRAA